jgi:hypothetical protein|tara:strand:- start:246 stop:875 length:630 start_codon:yes stop_codon:yes gene_type:complete
MNYTELKTNVQDICETSFTDDQLALFTEQAEQKIYNTVQIPALRKNVSGVMTSSNEYLSTPSDFLYVYSLAVVDGSGNFTFLLNKDVNFIREAYPSSSSTGTPKHYALFDNDTILLGPTPNSGFTTQLHYGYYPQSIVVAGTTWLGEEFDSALLNGTLVEAIRFMKGEPDMIALYEKMYASAVALLKILGDGKLRSDTYRSGQTRLTVQ